MAMTLYQAEWCPFSSSVREVLTELGVEFLAKQVEAQPHDRAALRELAGTEEIPVLQTGDGRIFRGVREIFRFLETVEPWPQAEAHRRRWVEHRPARECDAAGELLELFRNDRSGGAVEARPEDARVVDDEDGSRYGLWLGERRIGYAAYRLHGGRIVFTHTEIDPACEGRGFGARLVRGALDDARERGLEVVPLCSFVAATIRRHPEYAPLVA